MSLPGTEGARSLAEPVEGLRYPYEALERASETNQPCNLNGVISLAPVDASHPTNRARWVKFAILLYRYDIESGHCLAYNYLPTAAVPNPASVSSKPPSIADFLPWLALETAHFRFIYLTRTGTVLYLEGLHSNMLVDEEGLRTGRVALVDYEINGAIKEYALLRPFNMYDAYISVINGWGISFAREGKSGHGHRNQP